VDQGNEKCRGKQKGRHHNHPPTTLTLSKEASVKRDGGKAAASVRREVAAIEQRANTDRLERQERVERLERLERLERRERLEMIERLDRPGGHGGRKRR
jgi:hypothetical protein